MKAEGGDLSLLDEILLAVRHFPQDFGWVLSDISPLTCGTRSGWSSETRARTIVCALLYLGGAWFHIEEKEEFVGFCRPQYTQ